LTEPLSGVVCALRGEARCLGIRTSGTKQLYRSADGLLVALTGVGATAAAAGAERLFTAGAAALVSFGMAGGLDPSLTPGTLVLPAEVATPGGGTFLTAKAWCTHLAELCRGARPAGGRLVSTPTAMSSAAAKAALRERTGAVAVDMESAAIAAVAQHRQIPFVAVRAIVDAASAAVPRAVLASTDADGDAAVVRLLHELLRRPRELPQVVSLGRGFVRASRTLRSVARSGGLQPLRDFGVGPGRGARSA
jgi:adenosylhomocysteine nucleosidase